MENMVVHSKSFWRGKRVLLTGHTGFKGSWLLCWLLELGADVLGFSLASKQFCLYNDLHDSLNFKYKQVKGDILDYSFLNTIVSNYQPDIVFHLAAQALVSTGYQQPVQTWNTNVMGSINLLESLSNLNKPCSLVVITTDKVYHNNESSSGYLETDRLGGFDPYSASKAAVELSVDSWRSSFTGEASSRCPHLRIATARAGNVIGGGDFNSNRIVPDIIRASSSGNPLVVRSPYAIRPWQHVLEPLSGYLSLAEQLVLGTKGVCEPFNFGPSIGNLQTVEFLINEFLGYFDFDWHISHHSSIGHETLKLNLSSDKARDRLGWTPQWNFSTTIEKTASWYIDTQINGNCYDRIIDDINSFQLTS